MISKTWKIKLKNKIIEKLIFRYFYICNSEISKYRSFYISLFQILTLTQFLIYKTNYCVTLNWSTYLRRTNWCFCILLSVDGKGVVR